MAVGVLPTTITLYLSTRLGPGPRAVLSCSVGWECLVGPHEAIRSASYPSDPREQGSPMGRGARRWGWALRHSHRPFRFRLSSHPPGSGRPHLLAQTPGWGMGAGQVWFIFLLSGTCSPLFLALRPGLCGVLLWA